MSTLSIVINDISVEDTSLIISSIADVLKKGDHEITQKISINYTPIPIKNITDYEISQCCNRLSF